MKNIGLYSIILFFSIISFYITNKTVNYLKQKDELMLYLKDIEDKYYQEPINPIINNNTIIPGINGYKINIDKSYNKLKEVGSFNEQLLVYEQIKLKDSIKNHKDKYIIAGNKKKNMVSILLFIDNYYYDILDDNVIIGNDKDLKTFSFNKKGYCFNENKDNDFKDLCLKNNYYSLYADVITSNFLYNVKNNLKAGSIIVLKGNYQKELNSIINYIYSKGFIIANLDNHLNENI